MKKAQIIREYMPYGSVLIVDDVSLNLQVAKGMMLPYGLQIETVVSGYETIELIKQGNEYDIIFMDHMMPGMNGMDATKILREMGYKQPVVALTANAIAGQEEIFLANGFDGFISKPIDSRELNLVLNDFIRSRKPPEVVEAARAEQRGKKAVQEQEKSALTPEMEKYFVKDAENAVGVLGELYPRIDALSEAETEDYITCVHGIKSSLANIGEPELSRVALELEKAGKARNIDVMKAKTPGFADELKLMIEKYNHVEKAGVDSVSDEDKAFLREKLNDVIKACGEFDKKFAKLALDSLNQKQWTFKINEALDDIAIHLLHSAFKKAAQVAEKTADENE
jgi:CheY-like chemotaxis protein